MLLHPRFKPCYRVEVVEPDSVYLLSEREHTALQGQLYTRLAPLLDGTHSLTEISRLLDDGVSVLEISAAINRLHRRGVLCEASPGLPVKQAAFWSMQDVPLGSVGDRLRSRIVSVRGSSSALVEPLVQALEAVGVRVSGDDPSPALTVFVVDDYLGADLERWNIEALTYEQPWMLLKPSGAVVWVGPVFAPGVTACWRCLSDRLTANRLVETSVCHQRGRMASLEVSQSALPSTVDVAHQLAATHVCRWIVEDADELNGTLLSLDLTALSMHKHTVVRRPQCVACGTPARRRSMRSMAAGLASQMKLTRWDGGHRAQHAETTLARLAHHISPITGVVSDLQKYSSGSDLIHVYSAVHPFDNVGHDLTALRRGLTVGSAGKGKTDLQARVSAVGEAIERYCGVFTGQEERRTATFAQLADRSIHPSRILHFSDKQYHGRAEWNSAHSTFAWVPQPFDTERAIEWTPAWSLTENDVKHLPTAYCYYGYPLPKDHRFCIADSNGAASGNTFEEAILQGFLELVERDSIALWWYSRVNRPAVDLDGIDDPYVQALRREYGGRSREVWVLDLTSDLEISTFAAISRRIDGPSEEIIQGYGCHLDPQIALSRALTEMNQMLVLSERKPAYTEDDPDNEHWFSAATVENQPYLLPDPAARPVSLSGRAWSWSDDIRSDVTHCVDLVARHGMETLVLDQSNPEIEMNVVKVVVPGLRHFSARFAPGRLYDIPVQLGWVPRRLSEDDMNPIPISS